LHNKRKASIVVISDVHLGTFGAHAKPLAHYLKQIQPEILILNGDIIDGWAFSRRYWPKSHTKVLQRILKLMSKGTTVYYLTGNHDEMLRRYSENHFGNFHLLDKLQMTIDRKHYWFFHGDVFDVTMTHARWLAKIGGKGYDLLIVINRFINFLLSVFGKERISFSKRIKNSVKHAVKFISDFEETATHLAIEQEYDYVVCGHIHQPVIKTVRDKKGSVIYMNSGDWVENLTALEYENGVWSIYHHTEESAHQHEEDDPEPENIHTTLAVYENFVRHSMHR
jgi:UDP-2,3-diacylglucosamine pyrophosphatase LpxH